MINWRDLTIEDKPEIDRLINESDCMAAEFSFAILYSWRKAYNPGFAFVDNKLVVSMPQWNVHSYPLGSGDKSRAIDLLIEEAHSRGDNLVLRGLTDRDLAEFLPIYGDRFDIKEDRSNADYLYTTDHLCNLPGRKMSSKRNHIHKFENNGPWELREITSSNIQEARDFVDTFYEIKDSDDLEDESGAMEIFFQNFDQLGARAALLIQNDRPVAFSAGTRLSNKVFDVHFEKALPDVDGAYAMINREFARMIAAEFPEIEYFNREEDMGIPGLRKAKLSYRPDILLMKYYAVEKLQEDSVEIRPAEDQDYPGLRGLWEYVFEDAPEDVDQIYDTLQAQGFVASHGHQIISELTLYQAGTLDGKPVYVSYAIATDPKYRSLGYGSRLTALARDLVLAQDGISLLCPAEESLQDFYAKAGYAGSMGAAYATLSKDDIYDNEFQSSDFTDEEGDLTPDFQVQTSILSWQDYGRIREEFLEDIPHVALSDSMLKYIEATSFNGTGLLMLNNGDGICVLGDGNPDGIFLSELLINPQLLALSGEIHEEFAAGLARLLEASSVSYRTVGDSVVQAMTCGWENSSDSDSCNAYYGFPID